MMTGNVRERFEAKVQRGDTPDACWLWTAFLPACGYGRFYVNGKLHLAHRISYEMFVGPIPEGLCLDHLCRVRNCVNPRHLEPVTHQENVRRGEAGLNYASKTECPKGHPYSGKNLVVLKNGQRRCKACHSARQSNHIARDPEFRERRNAVKRAYRVEFKDFVNRKQREVRAARRLARRAPAPLEAP